LEVVAVVQEIRVRAVLIVPTISQFHPVKGMGDSKRRQTPYFDFCREFKQ